MNRLSLTDWQAAAAPYKKSRNRGCSGKGQGRTLVKPAIRVCRSEGAERAHTYKAAGVRRKSALVFSFAKPVIGKRFDDGTGGHISSVTFGDAFQLTLQSPQLRNPTLNIL